MTVDREMFGYLNSKDVDRIPCEDLRNLDQIWLHHSNGKFDFSIQEKIYERRVGTNEKNQEAWRTFGDLVGWRKEGNWLNYSELTFNQEYSRVGHLPECISFLCEFSHIWIEGKSSNSTVSMAIDIELKEILNRFLSRIKTCTL